jgi:biotin-(acetyl-CoA carboxylase) ligase
MAGLSLAVGLAVRAMLLRLGLDAKLKWPNDLLLDGRKLAGILVDLLSVKGGVVALIGIGLNRCLPPAAVAAIDQPVADLAGALDAPPPLDALALALLEELGQTLQRFDAGGFAALVDEWPAADALAGLPVRITAEGHEALCGTARGVDAKVAAQIPDHQKCRAVIGHCDACEDAQRLAGASREVLPTLDKVWVVETGPAIGVHAGPGSLVVGVQWTP